MPQKRNPSEQGFDANLLEPGALVTPGGLLTALDAVQKVCYRDDSSITEMIEGLSRRSNVLEYILSGTSRVCMIAMGLTRRIALVVLGDQAYEKLSKWIVAQFPTPATTNVMETMGVRLLQRLSTSLQSVEVALTTQHRNEFRELRRKAGLSLGVLKELVKYADRGSADTNTPAAGRKKLKAPAKHIRLDPHPFDCMGIAVPVTEGEVRALCVDVLPKLQNVLRVSISPSLRLQTNAHSGSGPLARSEATSGIRCIQTPT